VAPGPLSSTVTVTGVGALPPCTAVNEIPGLIGGINPMVVQPMQVDETLPPVMFRVVGELLLQRAVSLQT
jgi:hypothetical protein